MGQKLLNYGLGSSYYYLRNSATISDMANSFGAGYSNMEYSPQTVYDWRALVLGSGASALAP